MQSARARAYIRHHALALSRLGRLRGLELFLHRGNRVADLLHRCFQPVLRNAKISQISSGPRSPRWY
jgi:hypothetical protein